MFDYLIIFSSCLEKVIALIILAVMASYDDSTSSRVGFVVKEEHASEDSLDELLKVLPELFLVKLFHNFSKKNPPTKENEDPPHKEIKGPPRKESIHPRHKESVCPPLSIIPDDARFFYVGDIPTSSDSTITGFTDYASE